VMDMSFAVQALTVQWLVGQGLTGQGSTGQGSAGQGLQPGVHEVPVSIDAEVARTKLAALGVGLDELTPEQERYLSTWRA